jgi:hypothetical protein
MEEECVAVEKWRHELAAAAAAPPAAAAAAAAAAAGAWAADARGTGDGEKSQR